MNAASLPIETVHRIRDQCLCLASQRAARRLARRFDRLFAPLGLTNGQFSMLAALSGRWQPRLGELAEFLAMDSTTMTAAAKALEKSGFLVLAPDPEDRRARRPQLTAAGRRVMQQALPLWCEEHARIEAEVATPELPALTGLLSRLGQG